MSQNKTDMTSVSRGHIAMLVAASLAVTTIVGGLLLQLAPVATQFTLAAVEADVAQRFPMVTQLSAENFAEKLKSKNPPVLIDVRHEPEYRVSHIAGAERVGPDIPIADVLAKFSFKVSGRDVVFYCSVGMRSSVLALETQDALVRGGATGVYNLRGGIFGWHNAGRPVVNAAGPTDAIHPYNSQWGKLLTRQDQVRMEPAP
jgi:rhodanese-related sulfurtransferase